MKFTCRAYVVQGTLKGFDQTVNLILSGSHERVYSSGAGVEVVQLGLYIIRGDNMYEPSLVLSFTCAALDALHHQHTERICDSLPECTTKPFMATLFNAAIQYCRLTWAEPQWLQTFCLHIMQ